MVGGRGVGYPWDVRSRRRRSLLVLALCGLGSVAINWAGFYGVTQLMEFDPPPAAEEITYLELRPEAREMEPPEPPKLEPLPPMEP